MTIMFHFNEGGNKNIIWNNSPSKGEFFGEIMVALLNSKEEEKSAEK